MGTLRHTQNSPLLPLPSLTPFIHQCPYLAEMNASASTALLLNSRSPTHRALVVAEIVATICQFLQEDDGESLAALARTCRALRTPALEVLWGRLKNLIPIFRLLPPDAWAFHVDEITSRRVYVGALLPSANE